MMLSSLIQTFYQYNTWANARILAASERLADAQFTAVAPINFPSVQKTLLHIMEVQQNWLARFQTIPLPKALKMSDFPNVTSVRVRWTLIEQETTTFVERLDDDRLIEIISYHNDQGIPNAYPLWQMMLHQVNHATQHRSEVAVVLTKLGCSPGWLDFLIYIDALGGDRPDT